MFAVWNGKKLELISCQNKSDVIFAAARKAAGDAYLEMLPMSYINSSKMMHDFHSAKIAILCDEDGRNKKLPITLKVDNFSLVGPVIFLGKSGQDFVSLDDKQVDVLRNAFDRHRESEITIKILDDIISDMDRACDEVGITRDEFIENLIKKELGFL